MKAVVIDYGAGNLRSVANALAALGAEPQVCDDPSALADATHLVLPGVGAFGDCMASLTARGWVGPICDWVAGGRPYLGICLGYQMLFDGSEECPGVPGLGLVPGMVRRFAARPGLKIPHMGWNAAVPRDPGETCWTGLGTQPYFYFVHSYFPVPEDPRLIAAETTYGDIRFAAAIERGNLLACQFHPEKSQDAGLRLLTNFLDRGTPVRSG